jgi:hypothetical protein
MYLSIGASRSAAASQDSAHFQTAIQSKLLAASLNKKKLPRMTLFSVAEEGRWPGNLYLD